MFNTRKLRYHKETIAVVTATSYESPMSRLSEVSNSLRRELGKQPSLVIFDLLCSNGDEWNRFASMLFDGTKLIRNSFKVIEPDLIDSELLASQSSYFHSHPQFLTASVL
ncbi:type II toxin-antitoxin system RnlB family antitoxin [Vibrio alginolyticus]